MEVSTHPKVTWKAEHIYVWNKKNCYDSSKHPKGEFPIGAWTDEPDKVQWTDKKTGLACVIKRGPMGVWCGYVAVGPANPYYQKEYDGIDKHIDVHGGLTFSSTCSEGEPEHAICHIPVQGATDARMDTPEYRMLLRCSRNSERLLPVKTGYLRQDTHFISHILILSLTLC